MFREITVDQVSSDFAIGEEIQDCFGTRHIITCVGMRWINTKNKQTGEEGLLRKKDALKVQDGQ